MQQQATAVKKVRNERLEAALTYAARGWAVIVLHALTKAGGCTCQRGLECEAPGKHPRLKGWKEKATTDPAIIRDWFSRWSWSNVGIATGECSGLLVLDVDISGNGEENLSGNAIQNVYQKGNH